MDFGYFTYFADTPEQDMAARVRQLRYFQECVLDALPSDRKTASPTYHYFVDMVENLRFMEDVAPAFDGDHMRADAAAE